LLGNAQNARNDDGRNFRIVTWRAWQLDEFESTACFLRTFFGYFKLPRTVIGSSVVSLISYDWSLFRHSVDSSESIFACVSFLFRVASVVRVFNWRYIAIDILFCVLCSIEKCDRECNKDYERDHRGAVKEWRQGSACSSASMISVSDFLYVILINWNINLTIVYLR